MDPMIVPLKYWSLSCLLQEFSLEQKYTIRVVLVKWVSVLI